MQTIRYRWAKWNTSKAWQVVRVDGGSARLWSGSSWPVDDARWTWGNWVPAQDGEGAKNFWEPAYISPEQARTVRREP